MLKTTLSSTARRSRDSFVRFAASQEGFRVSIVILLALLVVIESARGIAETMRVVEVEGAVDVNTGWRSLEVQGMVDIGNEPIQVQIVR